MTTTTHDEAVPAAGSPPAAGAPAPGRPVKRRRSAHARSTTWFVLACLSPAVLLYLVFMVLPALNVFRMSVFRWSGFSATQTFVGLDNFRTLLTDMQFVRAFQNTVLLLVVVTVVTMSVALLSAAIMSREALRGRNLYRFVLYIPNILSVVVIAAMFSAIYDQQTGLLNGGLGFLGLDALEQVWLGDQKIVVYAVAAAMVWQSVGYYMVMYMAGMSGIPESLFEATSLDGAGRIRQFFSLTLPLIWTSLRTTLTFFIISSVNLSFVLVTAMTGGGPDGSSAVLLSYMYEQAYTNSSYGYGMAIGVVIFAFSFLLSLVVSKATDREPLTY
jgi:N-acetylglucosamine transport system permease protein